MANEQNRPLREDDRNEEQRPATEQEKEQTDAPLTQQPLRRQEEIIEREKPADFADGSDGGSAADGGGA